MWRAFVSRPRTATGPSKPILNLNSLDGKFRDNVIVQIKTARLISAREPFSPLFGAMKKTPVMPEFQITQEYLGFSNHLVFLAPMWKECLDKRHLHARRRLYHRPCDGRLPIPHFSDGYCRCHQYRWWHQLVRTSFCPNQLVCFRSFGMETFTFFRADRWEWFRQTFLPVAPYSRTTIPSMKYLPKRDNNFTLNSPFSTLNFSKSRGSSSRLYDAVRTASHLCMGTSLGPRLGVIFRCPSRLDAFLLP